MKIFRGILSVLVVVLGGAASAPAQDAICVYFPAYAQFDENAVSVFNYTFPNGETKTLDLTQDFEQTVLIRLKDAAGNVFVDNNRAFNPTYGTGPDRFRAIR